MAGRGRGRGAPKQPVEPFPPGKEEAPCPTDVTPPPLYPPRNPTAAPPEVTPELRTMLDVGQSIKEAVRARMEAGEFDPQLGVPAELLSATRLRTRLPRIKKTKKKKAKRLQSLEHLDDLAVREQQDEATSDQEEGKEAEGSSESAEERDTEDSAGSEDGDEEMDEGGDYIRTYDLEEDEEFGPEEEDDITEATV